MNPPPSFYLSPDTAPHLPGLAELLPLFPDRFSPEGTPLSFKADHPARGFRIASDPAGVTIHHARPCDAYRALAHLLAGQASGEAQETPFESLGVMLDVSRNAVLRPEAVERLFRLFALMGINSVQLYMEDVYQLPDEPFFGYARGAYAADELRRIDDAGHRLGIEVIPCIQTLGHLEQILQWPPYQEIADTSTVLLAEDERSYRLIEKMLDTVSSCFRTRTVHIGMDEADGVGLGRYRAIHGEKRPFDVLNTHLRKVTSFCKERGLRPMMWSDMYFRLGSATHTYYDQEAVTPPEVIRDIPAEVEMVYWDYYHSDAAFYEEWIDRHRAMGKEPLFAAGAWTWGRHWAALSHALATNTPGMQAARKKGLRHAFTTAWGDDGGEFHPFSMLPAILAFAELGYTGETPADRLEALFRQIGRGSYRSYVKAAQLDFIPGMKGVPNYATWVLWHDPVFNFRRDGIPTSFPVHYAALADELGEASCDDASGALAFAAQLARTLVGKSRLHLEARSAVERKDEAAVRELLQTVLPETITHAEALWNRHREVWHEWHKPFGWEVVERRYAQLVARLRALERLLSRWLEQPDEPVEEFAFALPEAPAEMETGLYFRSPRVVTSSYIK